MKIRYFLWVYKFFSPNYTEVEIDTENEFNFLKNPKNTKDLQNLLLKTGQKMIASFDDPDEPELLHHMPHVFGDMCIERVEFKLCVTLEPPIKINEDLVWNSCNEKIVTSGEIRFEKSGPCLLHDPEDDFFFEGLPLEMAER